MKILNVANFRSRMAALGRNTHKMAALDMGTSAIGVALVDEYKITITPHSVIKRLQPRMGRESIEKLSKQLQRLVLEENVRGFVVGFPLTEAGEITPFCEEIVTLMSNVCNDKIVTNGATESKEVMCTFWDERYSTMGAKSMARKFSSKKSVILKSKDITFHKIIFN